METIKIQTDGSVSIPNGTGQTLTSLDLSSLSASSIASIEIFLTMVSSGSVSVLYYRGSEFVDSGLTNFTEDDADTASYNYSQSASVTHDPQYSFVQAASTIAILVNNATGASDTVTFQVSYILNFE